MQSLVQEVKFALRMLLKRPGFSAVIVVTLALGIGANCAIFSLVDGLLLKSLPYPDSDRLVWLAESHRELGYDDAAVSPLNFSDWQEQSEALEQAAAIDLAIFNFQPPEEAPERLIGALVTEDFFPILRTPMLVGQPLVFDGQDGGKSVVLREDLWRRRFNADPEIVGSQMRLNGEIYQVVGVFSSAATFPTRAELWVPLIFEPQDMVRNDQSMWAIGRLKEGYSLEQARDELEAIAARIAERFPETNKGWSVAVTGLQDRLFKNVKTGLLVLLGAVGLVLLIACVNVANLLLTRAKAREREIALRTALGASRGRLMRQLLVESLLLSLCGSLLGLVIASISLDLFRSLIPLAPQALARAELDLRLVLFSLALAIVTALFFGLAPVFQGFKVNLVRALKEGSKGSGEGFQRHTLTGTLVIGEVALALVLAISAVLLVRSFGSLSGEPAGFRPDQLLTLRMSFAGTTYETDNQRSQLVEQMVRRLEGLPGVEAAAGADLLPLTGADSVLNFRVYGRSYAVGDEPEANARTVTPGYFRTMEIPLISGRDFTDQDRANTELVGVINQAMARRFWPDQDPLGEVIDLGSDDEGNQFLYRIVGVVGDVRHMSLAEESGAEMYFSAHQGLGGSFYLVARTAGEPLASAGPVREALGEIAPELPLFNLQSMEQIVDSSLANQRFQTLLMASFAGLALLLAAIGVFGLVSYSVSQAHRDIGIRMALGADRGAILRLVLRQGFRLGIFGVGVGLLLAFFFTRSLSSLLYEIQGWDPWTYAGISLLVLGVTALAAGLPAWRAAKVDPNEVLQAGS